MPIDYSKWDKIELSDDSDIEVHPNVDKKSFIKWKQRDIHEKRAERNQKIKTFTIQSEMYANLNRRVDYLLDSLTDDELTNSSVRNSKLNEKFDVEEKFDPSKLDSDITIDAHEIEDSTTYNEMIDDLFIQITDNMIKDKQDPRNAIILRKLIKEHRAKIDSVSAELKIKLKELKEEKMLHISADDMHTGFDRSFTNKDKPYETPASTASTTSASTAKTSTIEKASTPVNSSSVVPSSSLSYSNSSSSSSSITPATAKTEADDLDLDLMNETEVFGQFKSTDLVKSATYLNSHINIINSNQKDALIMTAFDAFLNDDPFKAKEIIHQSLLLSYIAEFCNLNQKHYASSSIEIINIQKNIKLFFSKLMVPNSQAAEIFNNDVNQHINHIKSRCEKIRLESNTQNDEEGEEGEQQIQLKSLDPNVEISINLPDESSTDDEEIAKFEEFLKLPTEMQTAVKTCNLDEINKVFAKLSIEKAEEILEIFERGGILGIEQVLENEDEFNELQKQFKSEKNENIENFEQLEIDTDLNQNQDGKNFVSTADIVD